MPACQTQSLKLETIRSNLVSFTAYKQWAIDLAAPWLKANLDVIDFWMDDGIEAEVSGSAPNVSTNGQANVCVGLFAGQARLLATSNLARFQKIPNGRKFGLSIPRADAYLHMNARFMKAAG